MKRSVHASVKEMTKSERNERQKEYVNGYVSLFVT